MTSLKKKLAEKEQTIHTMQDEIREIKADMQEKIKKAAKNDEHWSKEAIRVISGMYKDKSEECDSVKEKLRIELKRKADIRRSEIETRYFFTMCTYLLAIIIMLKNKIIMADLTAVLNSLFSFFAWIGKAEFELIRIIASVTYLIPNYKVNLILHWLIIAVLMLIFNGGVGLFLYNGFYLMGDIIKKYWDKTQTVISVIIMIVFVVLSDVLHFEEIFSTNLVILAAEIFILTVEIRIFIKIHNYREHQK